MNSEMNEKKSIYCKLTKPRYILAGTHLEKILWGLSNGQVFQNELKDLGALSFYI